jgi:outer membrane protein TolC
MPATRPVREDAPEVFLSIDEARRAALRHNFALQVALLDPAIDREQITQEQAQFESVFVADARYDRRDLEDDREDADGSVGIVIPLRTGGQVELSLPVGVTETDGGDPDRNYSAGFRATLTQSLLRGGGLSHNAQRIRIAHYQYQASQARTKLEVIRLLADVERLYWQLFAARQALEVTVQEHRLAVEQLERAQRRQRVGVGAEVDVANAEAEVARILTQIIDESNAVRERQRELKRLINLPELEIGDDTIIITATDPIPLRFQLDRERLIRIALDERMDLLEQELLIAQRNASIAISRNDLLPLLSLSYAYDVTGLDGRWGGAFERAADREVEGHVLGLGLEVPIGNEAARSRLRQALARRLQQLATKESRIQTIVQEVLDAVDDLESNWQQILSTRLQVRTAARALALEINRFQAGFNTTRDVLEAQTRLARAQQAEIDAVTTYQINQIDLAFATGTTLGASGVTWSPLPAPAR